MGVPIFVVEKYHIILILSIEKKPKARSRQSVVKKTRTNKSS
jgi:hypothetical protein